MSPSARKYVSALNVTVSVSVAMTPSAVVAVTVMTLAPVCSGMAVTFQVVVPDAVPLPPRSLLHVTLATVSSSSALAVPASARNGFVALNVGSAVGVAMLTVAVGSGSGGGVAVTE